MPNRNRRNFKHGSLKIEATEQNHTKQVETHPRETQGKLVIVLISTFSVQVRIASSSTFWFWRKSENVRVSRRIETKSPYISRLCSLIGRKGERFRYLWEKKSVVIYRVEKSSNTFHAGCRCWPVLMLQTRGNDPLIPRETLHRCNWHTGQTASTCRND